MQYQIWLLIADENNISPLDLNMQYVLSDLDCNQVKNGIVEFFNLQPENISYEDIWNITYSFGSVVPLTGCLCTDSHSA